jgi:thioredoxin-like negative regulator of GroEL
MQTTPIVDRLAQQFTGCLTVVRADYATPDGLQLAQQYGVKSHPVIVVIDRAGTVTSRINGVPDETQLTQAVMAICR